MADKPRCYTCNKEVWFSKEILSKTGKQIPLALGTTSSHNCDPNDIAEFQRKQAEGELAETNGATAPAAKTPEQSQTKQTGSEISQANRNAINMNSVGKLHIIKGTDPAAVCLEYDRLQVTLRGLGARVLGTPSTACLNMKGEMEYTVFVYSDIPKDAQEKAKL